MLIMISFSEFFFFLTLLSHIITLIYLTNMFLRGSVPAMHRIGALLEPFLSQRLHAPNTFAFFIWKSAESHRDAQIKISAAVKYLVAPITWASNHVAHQENRRGVAASSHSNLGEMFSVRLCDVCCNSEVNWSHANIKSVSAEDASFWFRG